MSTFTMYKLVDRVLGAGRDEIQRAALGRHSGRSPARACGEPRARRCSTSPARNPTTSRCAIARSRAGLKLNEYGLFRVEDGALVAGRTEAEIYDALGLVEIPPELREGRGEIDAAERRALPDLITLADIRGDIHSHTTETDGRDDIETMAMAARDAGLTYLAITDHSKALAMANGLDEAPRDCARRAHPRNQRVDSKASRCWRASNATSGPTARWIWPTTASRSSTSSSRRCIPLSTRMNRR